MLGVNEQELTLKFRAEKTASIINKRVAFFLLFCNGRMKLKYQFIFNFFIQNSSRIHTIETKKKSRQKRKY